MSGLRSYLDLEQRNKQQQQKIPYCHKPIEKLMSKVDAAKVKGGASQVSQW